MGTRHPAAMKHGPLCGVSSKSRPSINSTISRSDMGPPTGPTSGVPTSGVNSVHRTSPTSGVNSVHRTSLHIFRKTPPAGSTPYIVHRSTYSGKCQEYGVDRGGPPVCRDDSTSQRLYVCQDANFNLTSITDTSGNPQERYLFDPYGNRTIMNASWTLLSTSAYAWAIGHQGLLASEDIALADLRNRRMHPMLGRFLRRDPLRYDDGVNTYESERSGPLTRVDPFGLAPPGMTCLSGDPSSRVAPKSSKVRIRPATASAFRLLIKQWARNWIN